VTAIWSPPGTGGWQTVRPLEPCGKRDCKPALDHSPNSEPMRQLDPAEYRPQILADLTAAIERRDRELARHEGSHAIASLAVGCQVIEVQIAGQPFCGYTATSVFADAVFVTIAGEVADGTPAPTRTQLLQYLQKVQAGTAGPCDGCRIASTFRQVASPEIVDDETLATVWLDDWNDCAAFFAVPEVRDSLDRLAAELFTRRRMTGDEIAEIIDVAALKTAREASTASI
jgi:hypothetical protein